MIIILYDNSCVENCQWLWTDNSCTFTKHGDWLVATELYISIQLWVNQLFIINDINYFDIKLCCLFVCFFCGPQGIEFRGYTIPQCREVSKRFNQTNSEYICDCMYSHCCHLMTALVCHWTQIVVGNSFLKSFIIIRVWHFYSEIMAGGNNQIFRGVFCIILECFCLCQEIYYHYFTHWQNLLQHLIIIWIKT